MPDPITDPAIVPVAPATPSAPVSPTGTPLVPAKVVPYLLAVLSILGVLIGLGSGTPPVLPVLVPFVGWMTAAAAILGVFLGASPGLRRIGPAAVLAFGLLFASPAQAQMTWNTGPTLPVLQWEPGTSHPVSIVPGAGMQLSLSWAQLQRAYLGKSWDLMDVNLMAFGSLVRADSGEQFGALSLAGGLCTMSSLLCLGGGKRLLTTAGTPAGDKGWFVLFAVSLNIASAPESPPVGVEAGAQGMVRGNTLFFGAE